MLRAGLGGFSMEASLAMVEGGLFIAPAALEDLGFMPQVYLFLQADSKK
jgi:hypothetical protein